MKTSPATPCDRRLHTPARLSFALLFSVALLAGKVGAAEAADSKPQLISKTGGGGGTWSDIKELEAAAAKGNPRAWAHLGELKLKGEMTPQDIPAGLELLEKAAKAGEASAAFNLGKAYDEGVGVTQDRAKALVYFKAAAAGKIPEAFYNLGASYASGRGVARRDYAEGLAWMILAKKAGVENDGEALLRERLTKTKRTDLIEKAAQRAPEIEAELNKGTVASFLPGAPATEPSAGAKSPKLEPPGPAADKISTVPLDRGKPSKPVPVPLPPPNPAR